jgi:hypothetical protein
MARRDDIFLSFMHHPTISEKYNILDKELPRNLTEGLVSKHVIIQTIALIVEALEKSPAETEKAIETKIKLFLQKEAI